MNEWSIEPLDRSHLRQEFCCGNERLDRFLRELVGQYERRKLGRTFVAVRAGEKRVFGYFTLAAGSVSFQELPACVAAKLPKHPVPVVLLARLAVDRTVQGQGLGKQLLLEALQRCLDLSGELGIHAVRVQATDKQAERFYRKFGFVALRDDPLQLYLPIKTIKDAFGREQE